MAARLIRGAPYFPVHDPQKSITFYADMFGFKCEYQAGDPVQFAMCSRDGLPVMFKRVDTAVNIIPNEKQGGTWDVFFWVTDVEDLFREFQSKGAAVVYAPTIQEYGMKEFAVRDEDGYVLGFGEMVKS